MLKVLYFARLKEALGTAKEDLPMPQGVTNILELMHLLAARGGVWAQEFDGCRPLRAAINQELAPNTAGFKDGDEIAFFPPVTGG